MHRRRWVIGGFATVAWVLAATALTFLSLGNLVFSITEADSESNRAPAVLVAIAVVAVLVCTSALVVAISTALGRRVHPGALAGGILLTSSAVVLTFVFWLAVLTFTGNT